MFLFDTDIVSNILKRQPSTKLTERLRTVPRQQQFLSTITIAEMVYGAMKSTRADYHLKQLHEDILPGINIAVFDSPAAFIYGALRAELEKRGEPLSHTDLQIASIAIANDYTLITNNLRHFRRIVRLRSESWL
jgi:tRNA(fMet)-specific endonuclease VapC